MMLQVPEIEKKGGRKVGIEIARTAYGWTKNLPSTLLNPFQIIVCLTFFTSSLTTRLIQKCVLNIRLALLTKVFQELLKFNYVRTHFFE
jgi:hypothetical protein